MTIFIMSDGSRKMSVTALLPLEVWSAAKSYKISWSEMLTEATEARIQALKKTGVRPKIAASRSCDNDQRVV